jgi:hypothetical protein
VLCLPVVDRAGSWITVAVACLSLASAALLLIHGLV